MARTKAGELSEETKRGVHALAEEVRALDAPFSCGWEVELERPVELEFKDGRTIRVTRPQGFRTSDVGKRLAARCKPASFGVGKETHRDPRVRSGGQLLAHREQLAVYGLDLETTGILREIHRTLCPFDPEPPTATLYSLNVYERGGHFVRHKDTPRSKDALGTLVVCLPVDFRGGRLVLRHETTRSFEWQTSRSYGGPPTPYVVKWAAFYGDVDHEIEPVREGTRVTLTWNLRRAGHAASARTERKASAGGLEAALASAIAERRFLGTGGTLGVPCVHLYPETESAAAAAASLGPAMIARLKGRDRLVAEAAHAAGLRVRLRPYLFDSGCELSWRLARLPTEKEKRIFHRRRLDAFDLEEALPIERTIETWPSNEDVTWVIPPPWKYVDPEDRADDVDVAAAFLGAPEYSATGYFGNEGSDAAFYVAAVLLVDVPSASKRRRARSKQ